MTALATDRTTRSRVGGYIRTLLGKIAAATTIYRGSLTATNAAGNDTPAANTGTLRVTGVAEIQLVNAGAAATVDGVTKSTGVHYFANDGTNPVTQADIGKLCYVVDDQTVQRGGTGCNGVVAGLVDAVDSGGVWVYVDPTIGSASGGSLAVISDNQATPGIPIVFTFVVPTGTATLDQDIVVGRKVEVIRVEALKRNGAGAGNTVTVKKGTTAISDAIACAVDNALTVSATIDDAGGVNVLDAGDTLRLTTTYAAGTRNARVTVICLPVP